MTTENMPEETASAQPEVSAPVVVSTAHAGVADPSVFAPARPVKQAGGMQNQSKALAIAVAGWLVPGLGHALLKMWGRAAACFLTVGVLVFLGAGMRGNIFSTGGADAFDRLGYAADLGTGCFYFFARALESQGPDVSQAIGDYGTRFLATAGILNLLAALHAFEAARGHKA